MLSLFWDKSFVLKKCSKLEIFNYMQKFIRKKMKCTCDSEITTISIWYISSYSLLPEALCILSGFNILQKSSPTTYTILYSFIHYIICSLYLIYI